MQNKLLLSDDTQSDGWYRLFVVDSAGKLELVARCTTKTYAVKIQYAFNKEYSSTKDS